MAKSGGSIKSKCRGGWGFAIALLGQRVIRSVIQRSNIRAPVSSEARMHFRVPYGLLVAGVMLLVAVASPTGAAQTSPAARPDPSVASAPHEKMTFFEGTWSSEPDPAVSSEASKTVEEETCAWLPGGRRTTGGVANVQTRHSPQSAPSISIQHRLSNRVGPNSRGGRCARTPAVMVFTPRRSTPAPSV
jgi:hypothetical protein